MYSGIIKELHPSGRPLVLSNDFNNVQEMKKSIMKCIDSEFLPDIVNQYYKHGRRSAILHDYPDCSEVEISDRIGNITYLVVYKSDILNQEGGE